MKEGGGVLFEYFLISEFKLALFLNGSKEKIVNWNCVEKKMQKKSFTLL